MYALRSKVSTKIIRLFIKRQFHAATNPLEFEVIRQKPELVAPAKPTPYESKFLSALDSQEGLRYRSPIIHFYRNNPLMGNKDPVKVIREALAKSLVYYYPFAGRLREGQEQGQGRNLQVDCTGEGVMLIEADADVTLEEFGEALHPPFPCNIDELVYDQLQIFNSPLLLLQVTRLKCGGFTFAVGLNHPICDGAGLFQFMIAMGEMARGASAPSIQPVWHRELLNARDPPRVTCTHNEFKEIADPNATIPMVQMTTRSLFFGPTQMSLLRNLVPPHLAICSNFDLLVAYLWRCRTIALQLDPGQIVRVIFTVNARSRFNPRLPTGYYGNVIATPAALSTVRDLCEKPLGHAIELVMKTKADVTEEYVRSLADLAVIRGGAFLSPERSFLVSDVTHIGFRNVNFGWGNAAYGGPAKGGLGPVPGWSNYFIPFKNKRGEKGIVVPFCLPTPIMERFMAMHESMLMDDEPILSDIMATSIKAAT